ncbi:hypothetical protein GA0061096_3882 [Fictibacillus enclensis]|uniref:Uncharacterized protein n=1 Tax=Fictibacillus enclensis TaxID=1017270 RepID=A0A0V8J1Q1_9BACL|nr:hypothetical protein [Fictibacillus enclensis]KSU80943.1 hypothetical protein AS030_18485 [Fictibacillus enclensis]SCC33245.1 hypothetical protein GA0061096_3882 [Fictibacillus enclensis]
MKKITISLITTAVLFGAGFTYYHVSASGTYDNLPKEKREIMERKAENKNKARNDSISKKDGVNGPLVVQNDSAVAAQILTHVEDPVNDQKAKFTNGWVSSIKNGEMSGKNVTVEAGALTTDSLQGYLIVRTEGDKRKYMGEKEYKTPSKHGAVKIAGAKGFILTLQAKDGKKWSFDIPTGTFKDIK